MADEIKGKCSGTAPFPISILDFAMAGRGMTAYDALNASIELAKLVDQNLEMALDVYRRHFEPSDALSAPYVIASFGVMAADDEREARRQAWAYSHAMMRMTTRRSFVVPTPDEAERYDYMPTEQRIMQMWNAKIMTGTGVEVAEQLSTCQQRINADELMILNLGHSPEAIYRSTELIADACGLPDAQAPDKYSAVDLTVA